MKFRSKKLSAEVLTEVLRENGKTPSTPEEVVEDLTALGVIEPEKDHVNVLTSAKTAVCRSTRKVADVTTALIVHPVASKVSYWHNYHGAKIRMRHEMAAEEAALKAITALKARAEETVAS